LLFVVLGSSLALYGVWGILGFVLIVGLAIWICYAKSLTRLAGIVFVVLALAGLVAIIPAISAAQMAGRCASCMNNLRQIALALHEYHRANGRFPPAYIADKDGKPMHSWRVLILPYLNEATLYNTYNFKEPWDGSKNKVLLSSRPRGFVCPSDPDSNRSDSTETNYVAVVGRNAAWRGDKSRKLGAADFPGGGSHTILLVEVANSGIAWTEPRDMSLDALDASSGTSQPIMVSSRHGQQDSFLFTAPSHRPALVLTVEGQSHFVPPGALSDGNVRKMLQVDGFDEEALHAFDSSFNEAMQPNWPNITALAVWLLSVGMLLTAAVRSRKKSSVPPTRHGGCVLEMVS
jgi:hypothetical protein